MNIYVISSVIAFAISFFLSLFVYLKGVQDKRRKAIIFIILCAGTWCLFPFLALAGWPEKSLFSVRLVYIAAIFTAPAFLKFGLTILDAEKIPIEQKLIKFSFLVSCLIFLPFLFSPIFIRDVIRTGSYFSIAGGPLYIIFIFYFGIVCLYCFYKLYLEIKKSSGSRKNQLRYVFVGFLFAFFSGLMHFSASFGVAEFFPHDFLVVACMLTLTYSILRHHLIDIKIALTRAGIFAVVYALVLGIPLGLTSWGRDWLQGLFGENWYWAPVSLAIILATAGPFIFISLRRRAESELFKEDLKRYETLKKFTRTLGRAIDDLDKLLKLIAYRVVKTLMISYGAIYLYDEELKGYALMTSYSLKGIKSLSVNIAEDSDFIKFIYYQRKAFLYEDVQRLLQEQKAEKAGINSQKEAHNQFDLSKVAVQMKQINAALVMPSLLGKELIGFLILAEKISTKPYSATDIDVLSALSRSASVAITNAITMIDLKKTEGELAEASRIAQIGYLASSTGHQLGNNLNNIMQAGYGMLDSGLILDCFKDRPAAKTEFERIIADIITNAKDGDLTIEEIRSYGQSEREKKHSLVNLKDILNKTLRMLYIQVGKFHNIDITINIAEDVPSILGSFVGMQNVFVNLFNNAYDTILEKKTYLEAHPELGIKDYKGKLEVQISRLKGNIAMHIIDDGKGIPADVLKKLFTPHYTTKASSEKREERKLTGGTGIGLFTIRKIVNNHGGKIDIYKTELLKGTDFLIQLPIPKESDISKERA
ncbi:MAG: ATP-binding protein [Candidatus Omnitrophota bacterium]